MLSDQVHVQPADVDGPLLQKKWHCLVGHTCQNELIHHKHGRGTHEDDPATILQDAERTKRRPVELNLWTMIPMSTTTRAMLDPEAEEVDGQTDAEGLY